ncbi:MAG TPA: energy transducer TonB [Pyrinomonadaceae bacterium]
MRLLTALSLTLLALAQAGARTPQTASPAGPAAGQLAETNRKIRELADAKKYDEAAKLAETAAEEASRLFGPDSAEVSAQLSGLAELHVARRESGKAKKALARVLELREKRPGPSQKFEQDALELYTCLVATDLRSRFDPEIPERISRVLVEDSVLGQGLRLSPDGRELEVGSSASKPPPSYPPEARSARASGAAVMVIDIDEAGKVVSATPLGCTSRLFMGAGQEAALRATFKPTLVNGRPVKVRSITFYRWIVQ